MRPVELRLRNFRSYFGSETVLSFRDRRLVGIVGPIGSGKSSILDAISYALFGRTPTVARSTKTLINQRADDAAVALRFEVDRQLWEVVRSMRRRGQSQHALYRLDADTDSPGHAEKITGEGEVNERVVALIGLEFDAFNRSVLLAQGRFAEFLRAPPRERDSVLKGVFGHDRIDAMREAAKEAARVAAADAEKVAFQVAQLEEKATRLVAARAELVNWEQRLTALEKAEPEMAALDEKVAASQEALSGAGRRRTVLDGVAEGMPDQATTDAQLDSVEATAKRREEAAAALRTAAEAAKAAAEAANEVDTPAERDRLDDATRLLAVFEQARAALARASQASEQAQIDRVDTSAAFDRLTEQAAKTEADLSEARQRAADAARLVVQARDALHAAEHADMAATLRAGLEPGAPCPVCEQDVATVPTSHDAPAVEAATTRLAAATEAAATADATLEAATAQHSAAAAAVASAGTESERSALDAESAVLKVAEAKTGVDQAKKQLADVLGVVDDFGEALGARRRTLSEAAEVGSNARRALDAARLAHDEAVSADQAAQKTLSTLQVAIAQLTGRLGIEAAEDADQGAATLRAQVDSLRAAWLEQSQSVAAAVAEHTERIEALQGERASLLEDLTITTSFAEELGSARARTEERKSEITRLETELEASAELIEDRDTLVGRRDVMQRLASDLTDSRFIRFLLDEERAELADLGSEHLMRLTSGRYEFDRSGSFDIVDLAAADAVRKADSLSGGETFLASLGLALALAEMVARTGGRLESFFLDEGFGSLDPEHLDLAMEGIEALASDAADRLVVVVSHVPELRLRIEDLIELDRNPTTGDTRVVRA